MEGMITTIAGRNVIWLAIFIILLLIEALTVGARDYLVCGRRVGSHCGKFPGDRSCRAGCCLLLVSCLLFVFTRPWAMKYINKKRIKTNYEKRSGK